VDFTLRQSTVNGVSKEGGSDIYNSGELIVKASSLKWGCLLLDNDGTARLLDTEINGYICDGFSGIYNAGMLRMTRSTLYGCHSTHVAGLKNSGTAILDRTSIRDNEGATEDGWEWSGIENLGTLLTVNSTISGNYVEDASGSGVLARSGSDTYLYNSTLVSPSSDSHGPNSPTLSLELGSAVTMRNTIIARTEGGPSPDPPCSVSGALTELGGNIASDTGCGVGTLVVDPLLGPLQDNGGPTWTHALLPGSPAIDYASDCIYDHDLDDTTPEIPIDFDQRTWFRPAGQACDSGAFEADSAPLPVVTDHRVLDCTAQQEIATLIEGETYSVDLNNVAKPACIGVGVLIDANAVSGDGSVGHDYIPAAGETVSDPYEGENYEPYAMLGDYWWVVPGEIADCHCDNPERGDLTHPGVHTITSIPCSADFVSWTAGDKAAQCEAASGLAGPSFTTDLVVVPEPSGILALGSGIALLLGLQRRRCRERHPSSSQDRHT